MSGMGGAIALNQIAVMQRIEMAGIKKEDQEEILDSVIAVSSYIIEAQRDKDASSGQS